MIVVFVSALLLLGLGVVLSVLVASKLVAHSFDERRAVEELFGGAVWIEMAEHGVGWMEFVSYPDGSEVAVEDLFY